RSPRTRCARASRRSSRSAPPRGHIALDLTNVCSLDPRPVPTAGAIARNGATSAPTRELILDTAERLFAARGVDGVAVRDLAREMGITASSLYNHFPGKRALYDAVLARGLGPIVETVAVAWQDEIGRAHV